MPENQIQIKLVYDAEDYQTIKLAAAVGKYSNLKSYATQVILAHARKLVADFQSQATHAGLEPPTEGKGGGT